MKRSVIAALSVALIALVTACADSTLKNPDPNNESPFGWMDSPKAGDATTPGQRIAVSGWALDDSSVAQVRIFVDRHFKVAATISEDRPDLAQPYPTYIKGSNRHGWRSEVEMPTAPGRHEIVAQAVDDQGISRDVTTVAVDIR